MTEITETIDGVRIATENYEVSKDGQQIAEVQSTDTEGWSPYEPCPHCGSEHLSQLEVGDEEIVTEFGQIQDFIHNENQDAIEVSCTDCGETLWRHMAVQLIFDVFDDRPF